MSERFDGIVSAVKSNDLVRKIRKQEEKKKGHPIVTLLVIVGAVATVAAIAYAVYRYMNPKYADFDSDFDYDDFDDDFDDDLSGSSDPDDSFDSTGA
ncbi:MAG: DUF4366 domain-containing protein [Eubacterium sp.]|nr:DUF4366 domain-containing protein [Eubacterium sp.]